MIQKYTYGTPFETDAIVTSIPASEGTPAYGTISTENGFSFTYDMDDNDVVYGLGESNRGINKRGYVYESNCSDQPNHTEDKISLYGACKLCLNGMPVPLLRNCYSIFNGTKYR